MNYKPLLYCIIILVSIISRLNGQQSFDTTTCKPLWFPQRSEESIGSWRGNPAELMLNFHESYTAVAPIVSTMSGDFKRPFEPQTRNQYTMATEIVKVLGVYGTFLGRASYNREDWQDVPRSLRFDPYAGDAFLMNDTTTGDFLYTGPDISVYYSYELFNNFFIGFDGQYQIFNGLKNVYTRAHNLVRILRYGVGAVYSFTPYELVGLAVHGSNYQQKIESKGDLVSDVEIFSLRGDNFAVKRRGSTVEQIFRSNGIEAEAHSRISLTDEIKFVSNVCFATNQFKSLVHSGLLLEYEDGFAQFQLANGFAQCDYFLSEGITITGAFDYEHYESWSKLSSRNLLVWKWARDLNRVSLGLSLNVLPELQWRIQGMIGTAWVDSSKYIDNNFVTVKADLFGIGTGIRTSLFEDASIAFGMQYENRQKDYEIGGSRFNRFSFVGNISYNVTSNVLMLLSFEQNFRNAKFINRGRLGSSGSEVYLTLKIFGD